MKYGRKPPGKNWRRKRKFCVEKDVKGRYQYLYPIEDCVRRQASTDFEVIWHRVLTRCSAESQENTLNGPWRDREFWHFDGFVV